MSRPALEDRRKIYRSSCETCRYCMYVRGFNHDTQRSEEAYFCTVDLSNDEVMPIKSELEQKGFGADSYSSKLLQIMDIEDTKDVYDSERLTASSDCCQFFDSWRDEDF